MKYMGLAFQLGATIAVGAFIGYQLDQWANFEKDYFTVLFVMLFAGAGLYAALKDLI
ncbi:MAG: AtpZ/AtpI family protein [Bacteroidota bacterium]